MLELEIVTQDGFDNANQRFVPVETVKIRLEHSLLSLSKWEQIHMIPFLKDTEKLSPELFFDYFRCMLLDDRDEEYLNSLSQKNVQEINEYINSRATAAWFNEKDGQARPGRRGTVITSDLIYYWMTALTIPFTCETWHLNRLLTLIRIAELESKPKKKMSNREAMSSHRSLNAQRRAMMDGKG